MIVKTLFLVLLGSVLVLSNPVPEGIQDVISDLTVYEIKVENPISKHKENDAEFPDLIRKAKSHGLVPRNDDDKWAKVLLKWLQIIESGKKNLSTLQDKWNNLKDKGLKLLEEAQKVYNDIKVHGAEVIDEFEGIYNNVKDRWTSLKEKSTEAYEDIKGAYEELKKAVNIVKEKWVEIKKIG